MNALHQAVMVKEAVTHLSPRAGGVYVDATFGAGGHSAALLEAADCTVHAFDRDENALELGAAMQKKWGARLQLHHRLWSEIPAALKEQGVSKIDGLLIDSGVSSMQLDDAGRGFSFQKNGKLSMQMGRNERDAYEIVNNASEQQLIDILRDYGHERRALAIARAIVKERARQPIETTLQLAALCGTKRVGHHPATRTFLALRLYVNEELDELRALLNASISLLNAGGRLVYIGFHGTEDVVAKNFFKMHSRPQGTLSRLLPYEKRHRHKPPLYRMVSGHVIKPTREEVLNNPRARSARLRAAERLEAQS